MAKTIREKLIEALTTLGEKQVASRSSKYVVMTRTINSKTLERETAINLFWYVGKAGALRSGTTVATSIPMEASKARLLARWEAAHG